MPDELREDLALCVDLSEPVAWRLDDVMPKGTRLDFSPPGSAGEPRPDRGVDHADERERKILPQITANAYPNGFAFVEDFASTFARQASMDIESLAGAIGRVLPAQQRDVIERTQRLAYEDMFIRCDLTHATFLSMLRRLDETAPERAESIAKTLGGSSHRGQAHAHGTSGD